MNNIPKTMHAVLLTDHGGLEKLEYKTDIPTPVPKDDEVLIKVTAAGINNTDINTRTGWYSKYKPNAGGSWSGTPLKFPRIQGADVCGVIVSTGSKVEKSRIKQRVIARTMQTDPKNSSSPNMVTLGSELNGAFAQYVTIRSSEVFSVNCKWSDAELGSIPCSYSTAEGLLHRVKLGAEKIFINGASGGVGSAAIQLAKSGARVILAARNEKKLQTVKQELDVINQQKNDFICADFDNYEFLSSQVKEFISNKNIIHILVNNSGGPDPGSLIESNPKQFIDGFNRHLINNQNLSMQITTIQKLKNLIDKNYKVLIGSIVALLLIILIISL